jgi:hypothetical protein
MPAGQHVFLPRRYGRSTVVGQLEIRAASAASRHRAVTVFEFVG